MSETEQAKAFYTAVTATATPQQLGNWTTADVAQRMVVAHHPDWSTHYAHAWGLDPATATEISTYLKRYPGLPGDFFASNE